MATESHPFLYLSLLVFAQETNCRGSGAPLFVRNFCETLKPISTKFYNMIIFGPPPDLSENRPKSLKLLVLSKPDRASGLRHSVCKAKKTKKKNWVSGK